jgi:NAD(P)-dependent dehydrogenase (short-subunit alcohol dehydrogenase family)
VEDFLSRTVVVTGANSGIGLATCVELARVGYDVVGTVRSEEKGQLLQDAAVAKGVEVSYAVIDVADAKSTEEGFAAILAERDIWAVVNNAGYAQAGAVEDVDDDLAREQLEINLLAPARIARIVLPGMRERGEGRIVNVSSVAGRVSIPLIGWYSASKHALEALTDALRMEVEQFGVRVILIEPGSFGTAIWPDGSDDFPEPSDPAYAAAYARSGAVTAGTKLMPHPVWVARTIRVALANPVPLARYLIGVDAVGGFLSEKLVPTIVTDYVKGLGAGTRSLPLGLPFRRG